MALITPRERLVEAPSAPEQSSGLNIARMIAVAKKIGDAISRQASRRPPAAGTVGLAPPAGDDACRDILASTRS
jgi:hypothetical protein